MIIWFDSNIQEVYSEKIVLIINYINFQYLEAAYKNTCLLQNHPPLNSEKHD